jgi:hypothetical protein
MGTVTGKKRLFNDSKLGLLANGVVTVAALAVVEWIGTIDFSTMPTIAATLLGPALGMVANAIVSWAAPRDSGTAASPGVTRLSD